jgi:hypothetical protein
MHRHWRHDPYERRDWPHGSSGGDQPSLLRRAKPCAASQWPDLTEARPASATVRATFFPGLTAFLARQESRAPGPPLRCGAPWPPSPTRSAATSSACARPSRAISPIGRRSLERPQDPGRVRGGAAAAGRCPARAADPGGAWEAIVGALGRRARPADAGGPRRPGGHGQDHRAHARRRTSRPPSRLYLAQRRPGAGRGGRRTAGGTGRGPGAGRGLGGRAGDGAGPSEGLAGLAVRGSEHAGWDRAASLAR